MSVNVNGEPVENGCGCGCLIIVLCAALAVGVLIIMGAVRLGQVVFW